MNAAQETLQVYERWAPLYPPVAHNPLMRIEQRAMLEAWPHVAGRRVLDLACGSGRYSRALLESKAAQVVSLDFCMPMLQRVEGSRRVCASMMQLPFLAECFDVVVSGLALAHASAVRPWAAEVSRVLCPGGTLLYSDFHPEAARAGLTRSFKDAENVTLTVPHQLYSVDEQVGAAVAAGLRLQMVRELRVGYELQEPFPGSESFYSQWHGLPLVLVVRAGK
ncbi:MAG: methyltransferase domain-containing protein [Proteobacteria bacterium]|nr:methyltransferase domain-containing protein [Pseudomonadota bacterium]